MFFTITRDTNKDSSLRFDQGSLDICALVYVKLENISYMDHLDTSPESIQGQQPSQLRQPLMKTHQQRSIPVRLTQYVLKPQVYSRYISVGPPDIVIGLDQCSRGGVQFFC